MVDLHALTVPGDPAELRARTWTSATLLLAAGLDPDVCTLFVQSHVPEHTELTWLLECTASYRRAAADDPVQGEVARAARSRLGAGCSPTRCSWRPTSSSTTPTGSRSGDDQRQHLELTRDLAIRFNHRYGETFVVPEAAIPPRAGGRVMDLQDPTAKMSKSAESPQGMVLLLDDRRSSSARSSGRSPTPTPRTTRCATTRAKPGVSNLLELLAVATGRPRQRWPTSYTQYGPLKADTAAAVIEMLRPVQERYRDLAADPGEVEKVLQGADKARTVAGATQARARDAMGLVPPT